MYAERTGKMHQEAATWIECNDVVLIVAANQRRARIYEYSECLVMTSIHMGWAMLSLTDMAGASTIRFLSL